MALDIDGLARRLKERRKALGMSQTGVAKRAGVSVVTLQKMEYGSTQSPDVATLEGVARALGVTVPWLLYGGDAPPVTLDAVVDRWSALMPDIPREGVANMLARVLSLPAPQRDALLADLDALRLAAEASGNSGGLDAFVVLRQVPEPDRC